MSVSDDGKNDRALLRYIGGFGKLPSIQTANPRADPELLQLGGWLQAFLNARPTPVTVIDFGCGYGAVLTTLLNVPAFRNGAHKYVGVDIAVSAEIRTLWPDMHADAPRPLFLKRGELFSETHNWDPPVQLIILRNVLHEIPLSEISPTFYHLVRNISPGAVILIQDMVLLPEGEFEAITWTPDAIRCFFPSECFSVDTVSEISRSGIIWMNSEIRYTSLNTDSAAIWRIRCRDVARSRLSQISQSIDNWYNRREDVNSGLEYAHLNHMYTKLSRELNPATFDLPEEVRMSALQIGGMRFNVVTLEGDGVHTYRNADIECRLDTRVYSLPDELRSRRNALINEYETVAKEKRKVLFDGDHYRLQSYNFEITDRVTEDRKIVLNIEPSSYYDFICTNLSMDKELIPAERGALTPRAYYRPDPFDFVTSPFANQIGINLCVITEPDNRLLYSQRSQRSFAYPSGYANAVNGDVSPLDRGAGGINPFLTAAREAKEEIGLDIDVDAIEVLGLVRNLETYQPDLIAMVTVPYTADEIIRNALMRSRDRFEYIKILSIPFDLNSVCQHLSEHAKEWIPQCAAATLYTLIKHFGYSETINAFEGRRTGIFSRSRARTYSPPIRQNIRDFVQRTIRKFGLIGNFLDVGSGYRGHVEDLTNDGEITVQTVDSNPNVGPDILADATKMDTIVSCSISCVICTELLEHVPEPDKVLEEIARVLVVGGRIILSVPFAVSIHGKETQPDLWRFTPDGIRLLLAKCFDEIETEIAGDPSAPTNVFATGVRK